MSVNSEKETSAVHLIQNKVLKKRNRLYYVILHYNLSFTCFLLKLSPLEIVGEIVEIKMGFSLMIFNFSAFWLSAKPFK